jgi:hypothetical protein
VLLQVEVTEKPQHRRADERAGGQVAFKCKVAERPAVFGLKLKLKENAASCLHSFLITWNARQT